MFKKVKLPFRKPTEYERFQAMLKSHQEQSARAGMETFQEANDFDISEDPDPLEHYFSKPTTHEVVGNFFDEGGIDAIKTAVEAAKSKKATSLADVVSKPTPDPLEPEEEHVLGVNSENTVKHT